MAWNFVEGEPVYLQIAGRLRAEIAAGKYVPGAQLPAVRELSEEVAVNPNTIQHAYMTLDSWGLTDARSTAGRFVTADKEKIAEVRNELAAEETRRYLAKVKLLGFGHADAKTFIDRISE